MTLKTVWNYLKLYALSFNLNTVFTLSCLFYLLAPQVSAQGSFSVYFDVNSSELSLEQSEKLKTWLILMEIHQDHTFEVFGYTDDQGDKEYNTQLSQARAESVKQLLVKVGVPESSIMDVIGIGELNTIAPQPSAAARKKNRRVDIMITRTSPQMAQIRTTGLPRGMPKDTVAEATPDSVATLPEPDSTLEESLDMDNSCEQEVRIFKGEGGAEATIIPGSLGAEGLAYTIELWAIHTGEEMLQKGMSTITLDGDCLSAGMMLMVRIRNEKGEVVRHLPDSCVVVRAPIRQYDPEHLLYLANFGKDSSGLSWQSTRKAPKYFRLEGQTYAEWKINGSRTYALEKRVAGSLEQKNEPYIWFSLKNFTQENSKIFILADQTVIGPNWRGPRLCYIRQGCVKLDKAYVMIMAEDKHGAYMLYKPLSRMAQKGGKYVIQKTDFESFESKEKAEQTFAQLTRGVN